MSSRFWALAILVPIACGWGWFISSTPIFRWNSQRSHDASRIILGDTLFDFSSQTAKPYVDDGTAASLFPRTNCRSYRVNLENRRELQNEAKSKGGVSSAFKMRITGYDHDDGRAIFDFDTSIEAQNLGLFAANQWFVIIPTSEGLRWLDLNQDSRTWQILPNPGPIQPFVLQHPDLPVFRRTSADPVVPTQATTELFRLAEDGQLRLLSSWTHLVSATPNFFDTKFSENRIYSVDVTGAHLECRSLSDGTLVDSFTFAEPVKSFNFSWHNDFVEEKGAQGAYYSLLGKRIENPLVEAKPNRTYLKLSPGSALGLWSDSERTLITETESGRTVCEIKEPGMSYLFLDSQTLISWDNSWGITLRQYDLQTGETLVRWHPFWWVWLCLAVLSIATLGWALMWIQIPKHGAAWGWCDFYILMSLCMILLVSRVLVVGESTDVSRLSFIYAREVCASGIFIASYMLFFSAQRWVVRIMHLLATHCIVLLSLVVVLHERPLDACQGLILVSIPSLMVLPLFALIAVCSMRFKPASDAQSAAASRSHVIQIRDLFWLMAIVALILVTIKPLLPGMGAWLRMPWMLVQLAWITLFAWVGVVASLTRNKLWGRIGAILVAAAFCLLAFDIGMTCAAGEPWLTQYITWPFGIIDLLKGCLSALAVSFFLARCLKLSGTVNSLMVVQN